MGFSATEINKCYSDSCDVSFRRDNKKKLMQVFIPPAHKWDTNQRCLYFVKQIYIDLGQLHFTGTYKIYGNSTCSSYIVESRVSVTISLKRL